MTSYVASYDRGADTVYIVIDPPAPSEGVATGQAGLVLDFDLTTGMASGVTLIGVRDNGWTQRIFELGVLVARHLSIDLSAGVDLIAAAVSSDVEGGVARLDASGVTIRYPGSLVAHATSVPVRPVSTSGL